MEKSVFDLDFFFFLGQATYPTPRYWKWSFRNPRREELAFQSEAVSAHTPDPRFVVASASSLVKWVGWWQWRNPLHRVAGGFAELLLGQ